MFEESTEGYVSSAAMKLASCAMLSLGFEGTCSKRRSKAQEADSLGAGMRFTPRSQSHRDYPDEGSYYLIVAQIDDCLVLLKLMFMLCSGRKGVFPPWLLSFVAK